MGAVAVTGCLKGLGYRKVCDACAVPKSCEQLLHLATGLANHRSGQAAPSRAARFLQGCGFGQGGATSKGMQMLA